jgi:ribonuclease MRP protein subunit RMP1
MASKSPDSPVPESSTAELLNLARLVDVLYIRNKNQHHRSAWWKHFNIFRKHLKTLTSAELQPSSGNGPAIEDAKHVPLRATGQRRVDGWVDNLVSAWHAAFTQLLTERRFANIGVVLVAVLARTCWLVGATEKMIEIGRSELATTLQTPIATNYGTKNDLHITREDSEKDEGIADGFDVGKVVSREQLVESDAEETVFYDAVQSPSEFTTKGKKRTADRTPKSEERKKPQPEKSRKKKRAKHEIDDIFAAFDT